MKKGEAPRYARKRNTTETRAASAPRQAEGQPRRPPRKERSHDKQEDNEEKAEHTEREEHTPEKNGTTGEENPERKARADPPEKPKEASATRQNDTSKPRGTEAKTAGAEHTRNKAKNTAERTGQEKTRKHNETGQTPEATEDKNAGEDKNNADPATEADNAGATGRSNASGEAGTKARERRHKDKQKAASRGERQTPNESTETTGDPTSTPANEKGTETNTGNTPKQEKPPPPPQRHETEHHAPQDQARQRNRRRHNVR